MRILVSRHLSLEEISRKLRRGQGRRVAIEKAVTEIIARVRREGDRALFEFSRRFDGVTVRSLMVGRKEIDEAYKSVDARLLRSLKKAKRNIESFHKHHVRRKERPVETEKGVRVWREFRPIERVGLYVPGGRASYCSTMLMLAVPARVAGCREVVMTTPPSKDGKCDAAVLAAANLCGIQEIYKIGGAQAIAAMAFGTETVPKVYKILGPGNQHVTTAKMLVYGVVDIDMPAGPSELLVIADDSAEPHWIAADLLAQLEHGEDSQGVLVTPSREVAESVVLEMKRQLRQTTREEIITKALRNSFAVVVESLDEACALTNEYAPEHLGIVAKEETKILGKIMNAGSVFLGKYTSETLGDYATGANHTLPTSGFSRMFSPLSTESFGKMIQVQRVSRRGIKNLRETVETLAISEGLEAHRNSIAIRLGD
ncbi:MAG: histidinol dehydrogenase [Candidatus Bathyarchaeota archaeon]|nr:MAG: histidinol dehydrogenase [Candidatus Bathyarchaeota archaeon]